MNPLRSDPDVPRRRKGGAFEVPVAAPDDADSLIAQRLRNDFARSPTLGSYAIRIAVRGGRVTLRGRVDREFQRAAAERIARLSSGVDRVTNRIVVERDEMAGL
jgi:osmotically-inducible protein OsmY